jgi:NAD+ kinase
MKQRIIYIRENGREVSKRIARKLKQKLSACGYTVADQFDSSAELIICVGGDGALLRTLAEHDFPTIPIIGVNTGHLGFFQELDAKDIDEFIFNYGKGRYAKQVYRTVFADILREGDRAPLRLRALNEIVIRGALSHLAHLNIFIGDSFVERFCGDGVAVSSHAGSTAYNYSLGGSIVDPRLNLLQVTPIAPINSTSYRSFTSGILLPPDLSLAIFPEYPQSSGILITADGSERNFSDVTEIRCGFHEDVVTLLRFNEYDFWKTVKQKLL